MQLKINTNLPTTFNVTPNTGFKDRFTLESESSTELLSVLSECMALYPSNEYLDNHKERFLEIVPYFYLGLLPGIFNRLKRINNQAPSIYFSKLMLITVMANCYFLLEDMLAALDDLDYHYASFEDFFNTHSEPVELWVSLIKKADDLDADDPFPVDRGITYNGKTYTLLVDNKEDVRVRRCALLETDALTTLDIYSCDTTVSLQQIHDEIFSELPSDHGLTFSALTADGVKHALELSDILELKRAGSLKGFVHHNTRYSDHYREGWRFGDL